MFPSFEDRARSSMARERAAQRDAELAEARAEVDQLRALVARQHKVIGDAWDCFCDRRATGIPGTIDQRMFSCLADPDGQRAAEEWNALVKVAEAAEWVDKLTDGCYINPECQRTLAVALDRLRAVREGKEEGGGRI